MKTPLTLEQIQVKLDFTTQEIEKFFKTINTPDNIHISKDRFWGQRNINIYLRLDEFSLDKLKEHWSQLETLFSAYKDLRRLEKECADLADIERATLPNSHYPRI